MEIRRTTGTIQGTSKPKDMTVAEIIKQEVIDIGVLYSEVLTDIEKLETEQEKIEYACEFQRTIERFIFNRDLRRSQQSFYQKQFDELNEKKREWSDM